MDTTQTKQIERDKQIQQIVDKIVREYQPEKIILFGSYAWGTPHEDSDVDLLVVKESDKKKWEREYELRMKLSGNKFPPMDLLMYTPGEVERRLQMNDLFFRDILDRGKVYYAR